LRHSGADMGALFQHKAPPPRNSTHVRPATAPSEARPLPGFERGIVGAPAPRVKPEASEIARRSQGQMSMVLSQPKPKVHVQMENRPRTAPPKQAIKGPIGQPPLQVTPMAPRVKSEGAATAALGHTGLVGRLFADSMDEARRKNIENSLKETPKAKNHIQQNIQRMRRMQRAARENQKQGGGGAPVKALWRSDKYAHVEPRVITHTTQTWHKKPTPNAPRPNTAPDRQQSGRGRRSSISSSTSTVVDAHDAAAAKSNSTNFVARNARNAWSPQNRARRSRSTEDVSRVQAARRQEQSVYDLEVRGTVPDYLVKRKEQWAVDAREKELNKPDPDCPKGHRRVSEQERRKVLENLRKAQQEFEKELLALPVRQCDTLKYKQKKMELEVKLNEIDEAIKTFSKKKVFVRT